MAGGGAFAERVRRRRLELRLTQRQAAVRAGVSLATWQSLERAGADPATFLELTLARAAHGLELPLRDLLEPAERQDDPSVGPAGRTADTASVRRIDGPPADVEVLIAELAERLRALAVASEDTFRLVHGQALEAADRFLEVLEG